MPQPRSLPFPVFTSAPSTGTQAVATWVDPNHFLSEVAKSCSAVSFNFGAVHNGNVNNDYRTQTSNSTTTNTMSNDGGTGSMAAVVEELKEIKAGVKQVHENTAMIIQSMGKAPRYKTNAPFASTSLPSVGRSTTVFSPMARSMFGEAAGGHDKDSIQPDEDAPYPP